MKKYFLLPTLLILSFTIKAEIIDLGSITRDTDTSLEWLDLTETRGLSYDYIISEMNTGGLYDGWRYAITKDFDQLVLNFGYVPSSPVACFPVFCDTNIEGDNPLIEQMINMLGDTGKAYLDEVNSPQDVSTNGAGFAYGLLGDYPGYPWTSYSSRYAAMIYDREIVYRETGLPLIDENDKVYSNYSTINTDKEASAVGSYLIRDIAPVPVPASIFLFLSGLLTLIISRKLMYK